MGQSKKQFNEIREQESSNAYEDLLRGASMEMFAKSIFFFNPLHTNEELVRDLKDLNKNNEDES